MHTWIEDFNLSMKEGIWSAVDPVESDIELQDHLTPLTLMCDCGRWLFHSVNLISFKGTCRIVDAASLDNKWQQQIGDMRHERIQDIHLSYECNCFSAPQQWWRCFSSVQFYVGGPLTPPPGVCVNVTWLLEWESARRQFGTPFWPIMVPTAGSRAYLGHVAFELRCSVGVVFPSTWNYVTEMICLPHMH